MRDYEDLEEELKREIEEICKLDPYGLSPNTLYRNVYASSGSYQQLSKLFEISPLLVKAIKES